MAIIFLMATSLSSQKIRNTPSRVFKGDKKNLSFEFCNSYKANLNELIFHFLKAEGTDIDMNSVMSVAKIKPSLTSSLAELVFNNSHSYNFPIMHYYPEAMILPDPIYSGLFEGFFRLFVIDNTHSYFLYCYFEIGNYSDVTEVLKVYKSGNQTYAKIKRENGFTQNIKILLNFENPPYCKIW
ncbi:MAG: hypothetical protein H6567_02640 [Lewinellaceae bacterium]|nr:hypothetical protein [Lewinellaceae bacterium]